MSAGIATLRLIIHCRWWVVHAEGGLATYPAQAWLWSLQVIKYAAELATGQTLYNGKNKGPAFLMVYLTEELFESVCAIGAAYLRPKEMSHIIFIWN